MRLNEQPTAVIHTQVRRFRNIWFALVAVLWLPAVAHCQLEMLTGLEFLQCAEEAPASHTPARDCADCCSVEKAQFRVEHSRLSVPVPDWLPVFLTIRASSETVPMPQTGALDRTSASPDLAHRWHFLRRTALPVRAPSWFS